MPSKTASDAESDDLIGKVFADRYLIQAKVGEGGMGAVYRARHVHMQKAVAVKILHRELTLNDELRTRFEREAIASARIDHPHVTGATDFGKLEDGTCYLVLDFVSGESLKKLLTKQAPLPAARTVHIVRQIAEALEAAHTAGVVHRDLKPENVMLLEHKGEADFVKVLDFGIAKLESRNSGHTVQLTQAGAVFGTPEYMSPEQAGGSAVDGRADLYTIGVMMFEMLTGLTPFQGETIVAVLTQHLTVDAPDLPKELPAVLRAIVRKLLQKDPERRFQSARELLVALDDFVAPQTARTVPAPALVEGRTATDLEESPNAQSGALSDILWASLGRLLRWPIHLGGKAVPLWLVALPSLLVGALVAKTFWPVEEDLSWAPPSATGTAGRSRAPRSPEPREPSGGIASPKPAKPSSPEKSGPELPLARSGDANALAMLEAVAPERRSPSDWGALVVGLFRAGKPKDSLAALGRASALDVSLADEPEVIGAVAALALREASSQAALSELATHFGTRGGDLLYAWSKNPPAGALPSLAESAGRALRSAGKPKSAALEVTLELESAKSCSAIKALLPRATKDADLRAAATLQKKTARRGCGLIGLGDCFRCLRGTNALATAIEVAKSRPPPTLVEPLPDPTRAAPAAGSSVPVK